MNPVLWWLLCLIAWIAVVLLVARVAAMNGDYTPARPRDAEDLWPHSQPPEQEIDQLRKGGAL